MKKALLVFIVLYNIYSSSGYTQTTPPADLVGSTLRTWLQENWYEGKHTTLGYNDARRYMYSYIDKQEDDRVYCVYSRYSQPAENTTYLAPINCEHTVPQSFFGSGEPMKSDIHHLFPTHEEVNSQRSNYPFTEIPDEDTEFWFSVSAANEYFTTNEIPSASLIDSYSEKLGNKFEPKEDHKGDIARSVFYYFTMYPGTAGNISRMVADGEVQLLYQWHLQDPVSDWERQRNNRIAEKQGNRNPYIDYPEIACRAWNLNCTSENIGLTAELATFDKTLFGFASAGSQSYSVAAENLTEDLLITASADFRIALSEEAAYSNSVTIAAEASVVAPTTVYVRFAPSYAANKIITGSIIHSSGANQASITVQGIEGDPNVVEEVLYTEDFNDCNYLNRGWFAISNASNKNWECLHYGKDGTKAPEMNGYSGNTPSNDWLVSPEIDLTGIKGGKFSFWSRSHYSGGGQKLKVFISTDFSGDVNTARWTEVDTELPPAGSKTWTPSEVDLSAFKDETVRMGFQYEMSGSYPSWTVDDFKALDIGANDQYVVNFYTADTTINEADLSEAEGEATATVHLDHQATNPFNIQLKIEEYQTENLQISFLPTFSANNQITLHFAPGDSVKTVKVNLHKTGALEAPAGITLTIQSSSYVDTGEIDSYRVIVNTDSGEEEPEEPSDPETPAEPSEPEEPEIPTAVNDKVKGSEIIVYPNPAVSFLKVKGLAGVTSYRLMTLSGKIVATGLSLPQDGIVINRLSNGLYLLNLRGSSINSTKMVFINK